MKKVSFPGFTGVLMLLAAIILTSIAVLVTIGRTDMTGDAQAAPTTTSHLQTLLTDLNTRGVEYTLLFAAPLATGETRRSFQHAPIRVGEDYFCFGEAWNDGLRYHCTPFANLISVTYLEP